MCALNKLPVANRGDIAVRLIRVARALGWSRVAVYSEADAGAPHMALADQAVSIGPAAAESYLSISRLSEAARATDAYAVHPGYASLAWSAAVARVVEEAGLVFVGPALDTVALMGAKRAAK